MPTIPDWIQAVATTIAALAALGVIWQLRLTREQVRLAKDQSQQNATWNRLSAAFTFLQGEHFARLESAASDALESLGVELHKANDAISASVVEAVWSAAPTFRAVRDYLNSLENYASGVAFGAIDDECAYNLQASYIIRHARVFKPFIDRIRVERQDHEIYYELEKLALEWERRFQERRIDREVALNAAEANALQARQAAEKLIADASGAAKKY